MISQGHSYTEIIEYTFGQFFAFLRAVKRWNQSESMVEYRLLCVALAGDKTAHKDLVDDLKS